MKFRYCYIWLITSQCTIQTTLILTTLLKLLNKVLDIIKVLVSIDCSLTESFLHLNHLFIDRLSMIKALLLCINLKNVLLFWLNLIRREVLKLVRIVILIINNLGVILINLIHVCRFGRMDIEFTNVFANYIIKHCLSFDQGFLCFSVRLIITQYWAFITFLKVKCTTLVVVLAVFSKVNILKIALELLLTSSKFDPSQPSSLYVELSGLRKVIHHLQEFVFFEA